MRQLGTTVALLVGFTVITGILYPLLVTGAAAAFFPDEAHGSLLRRDGTIVGSALVGQEFTSPGYFWSRLSPTASGPYNAASSAGSNYGPLHPALLDAARDRAERLRRASPGDNGRIPVDLVTASGSGLDPHISLAAALYQLPRVARERNISEAIIRGLVEQCTEGRDLGFLGEPGVNVLRLNLALDELSPSKEGR